MKTGIPYKFVSTIRFTAKASDSIALPKSVASKFSSQKSKVVEGTINNLPFQSTVVSAGNGNYAIKINKALQKTLGDAKVLSVEITRIGDEDETRVPKDLHKMLSANSRANTTWTDITFLARRDWIFWILSAKQTETRERRIEKALDMLSSGKRRVCCFAGIAWVGKK